MYNQIMSATLPLNGKVPSVPGDVPGKLPVGRRVDVVKAYPMGHREYVALRGVNLTLYAGEFTAIVGPSGSGKSTILNMITGIDRPTQGQVLMGNMPLHLMTENE